MAVKFRRLCALAFLAALSLASICYASGAADSLQDKAISVDAGRVLFQQRCASCHDAGLPRVPTRDALSHMAPDGIRFALTKGKMTSQAAGLNSDQIDSLVRFLTNANSAATPSGPIGICKAPAVPLGPNALETPNWSGWGAGVLQHRFQSEKFAGLRSDEVPRLKLKWAFGIPGVGQAYSQPAVAGGRIFVGSAARKVYSLDAETGCAYWTFQADAPVRTAISVGRIGERWVVYFGDQHASAYAVDADSGKLIWKTHLEDHPASIVTGAPTLAGGKLYVPMSSYEEVVGAGPKYECCKFRGSVSAVDAATGKVLWKTYTIAEEPKPVRKNKLGVQLWGPSGAAVWCSPTVDLKAHRVYVTTGDAYSDPAAKTSDAFVALDSETGKLVWAQQITSGDAFTVDCDQPPGMRTNCPDANGPDFDFGSSPILVELSEGHRALIAGQKSGVVTAVDPDHDGKVLWQTRVGKGGRLGGVEWGSASDGKYVYVAVSDVQVQPVTPGTPGSQRSAFGGAFKLDPKAGGGLWALNAATGEKVWKTPHPGCGDKPGCSPAQSAAVSAIPGVVFSGGLDGHLRGYSMADGRIVWDVDTKQDYVTVNGVKANGGSIDGPGAVIVNGMLFVNSGYTFVGGAPGNVLLAFSVDGK